MTGGEAIELYKKTTVGGQDVEVEITSISATWVGSAYHPGEVASINDFTVKGNYSGGQVDLTEDLSVTSDIFTYEDAPSGGYNGTKTLSVSYAKEGCKTLTTTVDVSVNREIWVNAGVTFGTSEFSEQVAGGTAGNRTVVKDGVTLSATNAYLYNETYLSLNTYKSGEEYATDGVITSSELPAPLADYISYTLGGNKKPSIEPTIEYKEKSGVWTTDPDFVYDDYYYFRISYSGTFTGYVNFASIGCTYKTLECSVTNLTNFVMLEDTNGQCDYKTDTAIEIFEGMSSEEKAAFMDPGAGYCITQARARFNAWLKAKGKTVVYQNNDYVITNSKQFGILDLTNKEGIISLSTVIIISAILLTAVSSFVIIKKRKEK